MLALVLTVAALGPAASEARERAFVGDRIKFDCSRPLNLDASTRRERFTIRMTWRVKRGSGPTKEGAE